LRLLKRNQGEGAPFSQRGPHTYMILGTWGPQNWGAPFSHDTGPTGSLLSDAMLALPTYVTRLRI